MKSLALMIASLSIAGCAAQARSPEPVPVDKVQCARCGMLLSTDSGAGQVVSARDDTRFYDDLGCLAADWSKHVSEDSGYTVRSTAFVRLPGGGWSDVRHAWFARPASMRTAMGSGLAAYATADEARGADRDGRALSWNEVVR